MPQKLTTEFITTSIPGAYVNPQVKSVPVGVSVSGNIVIVGEAEEGRSIKQLDSANGLNIKDNRFAPTQASQVLAEYGSGNIVDAFNAVVNASGDADIVGSPNTITIVKTNVGSKSNLDLSGYGILNSKNVGVKQNLINAIGTQSINETKPSLNSGVIPSFGAALDGASFSLRLKGGAESIITLGTGGHTDESTLATEINGLLPAGLECIAGTTGTIIIQSNDATDANARQGGLSFELIDSTPGDLLALGLSAQLVVSSQEPQMQIDIKRNDINLNESFNFKSDIAFEIGYAGTTASLVNNGTSMAITVVGGTGANLTVQLKDFSTIKDMAEFINTQTGYSCSANSQKAQMSPLNLDQISIDCASTGAFKSGRIKSASFDFKTEMDKSKAVSFTKTLKYGLPSPFSISFLSNGAKGSTTSADIVTAINALKTIDVNFVIPLFSRDASADITDGLTDSSSTYTIDAIHALTKSHVLEVSTAKLKKNRQAFLSFDGSYNDSKTKAGNIGHYRGAMCFQKSTQTNSEGVITEFQPWHTSCVAAGMQAAGFYKPIFNKLANIISFTDPSGFDAGDPGMLEDALAAGLLILEKTVGGNSWVSDQTTYVQDENFVYNSIQATYNADLLILDLDKSFKTAFIGKSLADVDAGVGYAFLSAKAEIYRQQKLIGSSADAPLGYKNESIQIIAPNMKVDVEFKLSSGLYFIPINLFFSQISNG